MIIYNIIIIFKIIFIMTENDINNNIICSICTDNLEKNNTVIKTLDCNHQYHTDCIDIWLKEHNTCPLCRQEVKRVSIKYNNYTNQNTERNNKKYILAFILYILLLSGVIARIITLSLTINYIEFNNINSSNVFHKKKIINNFIIISVYISLLSILFFSNIFLKNRNCICGFMLPLIILSMLYIYFNILINNDITDYIKSLNNINNKKMNEYIINRNLIILIYDSFVSSIYILFIQCIF